MANISAPEERTERDFGLIKTCYCRVLTVQATPPFYTCNSRSFGNQQYELLYNRYMRANLIGAWVDSPASFTPDMYLERGLEDCHYDPRPLWVSSDLPQISALGLRLGTSSATLSLPTLTTVPIAEYLRRSAIQVCELLSFHSIIGNIIEFHPSDTTTSSPAWPSHPARWVVWNFSNPRSWF